MKIAYLGPKGTFTEAAAKEIFKKAELVPTQPIRSVILAVEQSQADFAVVPLENFYNGEVRETLDSLIECKNAKIIAERAFPIVHCLGTLKNPGKIKTIISKDQALEQCSSFICANFPNAQTIAVASTSEAISMIKKQNLENAAVIASEKAIRESGLKLIVKDIVKNNKTRFAVIGRSKSRQTGNDKTFIAIHPPIKDKPGVLYHTLGFFTSFNINLEAIISRPDKKSGYYFYIELDGHESEKKVKMALEAVKFFLDPENKYPNTVKILGSYKNTCWKN